MTDEWKVQFSKEINGDLWNFRAESAEEFDALMAGLAEVGDNVMTNAGNLVQVILAKNVQTKEFRSGGGNSGGGRPAAKAARSSSDGPPSCKHGVMKDYGDRGYKHRYYCPERDRDKQCPAQD